MSLRWYVRPRMVVLGSSASALEAARAIENNEIGAVLVHEKGTLVGIVTDRDLAVRVVGRGLDPNTTALRDVMTVGVSSLSSSDRRADAIRLMQDASVRRVPLVDGDRIVGMVTLDDLFLDETAPLEDLAGVVRAQIGAGGPAASLRSPAQRRRAARAEATYGRFLQRIREAADLDSTDLADTALEVVLSSIARRIRPDEVKKLAAQLPSLLQPMLATLPPGPDKSITREGIESSLVRRLDVDPDRAAELLAKIGRALSESVSAGQWSDVEGQLPQDLRDAFAERPPSPSAEPESVRV